LLFALHFATEMDCEIGRKESKELRIKAGDDVALIQQHTCNQKIDVCKIGCKVSKQSSTNQVLSG